MKVLPHKQFRVAPGVRRGARRGRAWRRRRRGCAGSCSRGSCASSVRRSSTSSRRGWSTSTRRSSRLPRGRRAGAGARLGRRGHGLHGAPGRCGHRHRAHPRASGGAGARRTTTVSAWPHASSCRSIDCCRRCWAGSPRGASPSRRGSLASPGSFPRWASGDPPLLRRRPPGRAAVLHARVRGAARAPGFSGPRRRRRRAPFDLPLRRRPLASARVLAVRARAPRVPARARGARAVAGVPPAPRAARAVAADPRRAPSSVALRRPHLARRRAHPRSARHAPRDRGALRAASPRSTPRSTPCSARTRCGRRAPSGNVARRRASRACCPPSTSCPSTPSTDGWSRRARASSATRAPTTAHCHRWSRRACIAVCSSTRRASPGTRTSSAASSSSESGRTAARCAWTRAAPASCTSAARSPASCSTARARPSPATSSSVTDQVCGCWSACATPTSSCPTRPRRRAPTSAGSWSPWWSAGRSCRRRSRGDPLAPAAGQATPRCTSSRGPRPSSRPTASCGSPRRCCPTRSSCRCARAICAAASGSSRRCAHFPFLDSHLLVVDSPHDGGPILDGREGGLRAVPRSEVRATGGSKDAEPAEPLYALPRTSGYAGLCGEPIRTALEGLLTVSPSVMPTLGAEGELLVSAWGAARLVTKTDPKRERMRRELWSKIEL